MKTEQCEVCGKSFKEDYISVVSSQYAPTSFMRCELCSALNCEPEFLQYTPTVLPTNLFGLIGTMILGIKKNTTKPIKIRNINTFDIDKSCYMIINGCESVECEKRVEAINNFIDHPDMSIESFDGELKQILEFYKENIVN